MESEVCFAFIPIDGTSITSHVEKYPFPISITYENHTLVIKDGTDVKKFCELSKLYSDVADIKSRLLKLEQITDTDT